MMLFRECDGSKISRKAITVLLCVLSPIGSLGGFALHESSKFDQERTLFAEYSRKHPLFWNGAKKSHGDCHCERSRKLYAKQSACNDSENEWGVPFSSDLPPLYDSKQRPLPKALPNGGKVTLLGSGPGDPDLLTVAAHRLLTEVAAKENTLVVVDRLVSQEILDLIQAAEIKIARKLPGCADLAQEEIYWWCYQGLNQGRHVIRLKIGDPFVFGRGGEEVLKFREFGVEPTVIPGVSAAFSAPLLGNIPVTHRGVSNQVVMCTGYGREGSSPDLIKYHEEQTIVFLMAVGRLKELCHRLITMAGYPNDTPVAIVERAGCPNQRTVIGDISNIASLAEQHNVKPPSTVVVGKVVRVLIDDDTIDQVVFASPNADRKLDNGQ
ncbi:hypothetical protein ACA910_020548 [Epithemia clementina (nom. ined.)]